MKRRLRKPKTKQKDPQTTMAITTGAEIRQAREDRSISVRELADKAGVSYQAILRWENGKAKPHPKTVRKVLNALQEFPEVTKPKRAEAQE